jgi:hypothetical protein
MDRLEMYVVLQTHWLCTVRAFAVTAGRGLHKIFPKEARGLVCPIGPVSLCGSLTLACQLNKLCFVDCIHA